MIIIGGILPMYFNVRFGGLRGVGGWIEGIFEDGEVLCLGCVDEWLIGVTV